MPRGRPPLKPSLRRAVQAVARALSALPVPGMLIGGIAVITRGVPRLTRDVDVTIAGGTIGIAEPGDPPSFSPPRVLFFLEQPIAEMDVMPDGQRFLIVPAAPPDFAPLRVLINWHR